MITQLNTKEQRFASDLAKNRPDLRWPKSDLRVATPITGQPGTIFIYTLVPIRERLVYMQDYHIFTVREDVFDMIQKIKDHFDANCMLTQGKCILTPDNSVDDPYYTEKEKQ